MPKLLDFGIAKILQEDGAPLATLTGQRLMTPEYASPEQARGERVTTASDVYSLGVLLYQLLTGQSPYGPITPHSTDFAKVVNETQPKKPSTVLSGIENPQSAIRNPKFLRGDLDNIVLTALRKEPERRYQSVEQFAEDIRRHLENRPVLARKDTSGYRAAKFVRRNKAALAAAAVLLLVLVGGIIATSWQAQKARAAQARAERRFNDVRALANSVLFDYHDAIRDLPGATKVRERLVKDALKYLDGLAGEAQGDPALQRELAAAYERVGDVRGGVISGNLGESSGAIESYTKALEIREALVARNRSDMQARRNLISIHQKLGFALLRTSEESKGFEHTQKAFTLCLDLVRDQPADEEAQFDLAGARNRLGTALSNRGDRVGALEQLRAALAVGEKLVESQPGNLRYRRRLWTTHDFIAAALFMQNDIAGAIEANRKAVALAEGLVAEDSLNVDYRRLLVSASRDAAEYRKSTDKRGALEYYRRTAALGEEILAADSANASARTDLAYDYKKSADLLVELADDSQAHLLFRKALEIYEQAAASAPTDLILQFIAVTCRGGVARMQARLGEVNPALEECRKATALLEKITGDQTGHVGRAQALEYLGYAYVAVAQSSKASASESRQHMSTGRDLLRQALGIIDDARKAEGDLGINEEWAREVAAEIARCDAALAK